VKIMLVKCKIIIGFYDSHCLTVNTRLKCHRNMLLCFVLCLLLVFEMKVSAFILMTFGYLIITVFIIIFTIYTYPIFSALK
jgi:hypothetical protein